MPRLRDVFPTIGILPTGPHNAITDVSGVRVGHATLAEGAVRTGVTAIFPGTDDPYRDKVIAAAAVLNGYGKSIGVMQIEELGTLETPILLTSTLNVPRVADALLTYLMEGHPEIGVTETVNPVVLECFDGYLNDARARAVGEREVRAALSGAVRGAVAEGNVGAGTGMRCMGYKSGIGTASRLTDSGHVLGLLVVPNFGFPGDLLIAGVPVGRELLAMPGRVRRGDRCAAVGDRPAPFGVAVLSGHGPHRRHQRMDQRRSRRGIHRISHPDPNRPDGDEPFVPGGRRNS